MKPYLDETELYLFNEGKNAYSYRSLGCHRAETDGRRCWRFSVWAPNAEAVSVVGAFNSWDENANPMHRCGDTGVWETNISVAREGDTYKYAILTRDGKLIYKADPFAFYSELRPRTASVIYELPSYAWRDGEYMARRRNTEAHRAPMSIYEVHLGSWDTGLDFDGLADQLVRYVSDMGYTHVELMPVCEYPLDDSWGYQTTGYFAVTSRYGTPEQFMHLIDRFHAAGIGVILDWVPAHFPRDEHGLRLFDGTPVFENPDPRRSEQPQWGTLLFDYGKTEVRSFLISSAVFFLTEYHIDALRVDAVSCMLYLDYGRADGVWLPNEDGGRENYDAIDFLRELSAAVRRERPGALLIAEESTDFPYITKPVEEGGLGFDFKWNMGFMNDTLDYMELDSYFRRFSHDKLTFSMCYAFSEHHILPFSHDEVVHGKRSLIGRMNGEYDDKFRQLRLLMMYQYAHPGKKLNFMGSEFGQFIEWDFKRPLDWFLLEYPAHADMQSFTRELNRFYRSTPAMYEDDDSWAGFEWLSVDDDIHSVIAFLRTDRDGESVLCAFNFTPVSHLPYRVRVPYEMTISAALSGVDWRMAEYASVEDEDGFYVDIGLYPYEGVYYRVKKQ